MTLPHDHKRFAAAQAIAALNGMTLHCIDGDFVHPIYIASRWAMTKQLETLDEVDAWLLRVTGKVSKGVWQ
jgi:hypothetical protein